jgi:hypothetical protein
VVVEIYGGSLCIGLGDSPYAILLVSNCLAFCQNLQNILPKPYAKTCMLRYIGAKACRQRLIEQLSLSLSPGTPYTYNLS